LRDSAVHWEMLGEERWQGVRKEAGGREVRRKYMSGKEGFGSHEGGREGEKGAIPDNFSRGGLPGGKKLQVWSYAVLILDRRGGRRREGGRKGAKGQRRMNAITWKNCVGRKEGKEGGREGGREGVEGFPTCTDRIPVSSHAMASGVFRKDARAGSKRRKYSSRLISARTY